MATCHKSCFPASILLAIKNDVAMDQFVVTREAVLALAGILERLVLVELSKLKSDGFLPQTVAIGLVKGSGFLHIAGDLDTELVAGAIVLGLATSLVQHSAKVLGTTSVATKELPSRGLNQELTFM